MIEYIGLPYKKFSRGPDSFDCLGLVMDIYSKYQGIELFDYAYSDTHQFKENASIFTHEEASNQWIKVDRPIKHDLVVFNIAGYPVHVGVMVDDKRFIHAHESCDIAIEPVTAVKWRSRINGYYRHKGTIV